MNSQDAKDMLEAWSKSAEAGFPIASAERRDFLWRAAHAKEIEEEQAKRKKDEEYAYYEKQNSDKQHAKDVKEEANYFSWSQDFEKQQSKINRVARQRAEEEAYQEKEDLAKARAEYRKAKKEYYSHNLFARLLHIVKPPKAVDYFGEQGRSTPPLPILKERE